MKYVCDVCVWEYDEEKGYPEGGIAPGTKWEDVPEDFECPLCFVGKDHFSKEKGKKTSEYLEVKIFYLSLHSQSGNNGLHEEGSIAQLVQSVCLTSRGSGVRIPVLPPENQRVTD